MYRVGQLLGFLWFALLTVMITGALVFGWLEAQRPEAGQQPQAGLQQTACIIWADLGRPCD